MELQELVGKLELPEVIEGVLWEKLRRSGQELSRMAKRHPERFGFACGMLEL